MTTSINTSGINIGKDGKITFSGVSSGIDSKGIIDSLMTAKRLPAVRLETNTTKNNEKITALKELQALTKDVTTALDALRGSTSSTTTNLFKQKTATGTTAATLTAPVGHTPSALGDLVVATIGNTAQTGTYEIEIDAIAKAHQLRSDSQTTNTSALSLSGTLSLNGENISVTNSDTLLDIRDKINASDAGVTATVVSASSTSHYLVLTSSETGVANAITIGANALSDSLGLTAAAAIKNPLQAAADAQLTVNGISGITRSSNQVTDLLSGVTLSLVKAEPDTKVNLNISSDLNGIKAGIADFVEAYNGLRDWADDQRTPSDRNNDGVVADDEVGTLAYDSNVRQILQQLGQLAATEVSSNTDGFRSLGQLGITVDSDYKLSVDDTILDSRLLSDVNAVKNLFAVNVTASDSRVTYLDRSVNTTAGTYYVNIAGTDASGNVTSANIRTAAGAGAGGADDNSIDVSGSLLTVNTGSNANGLKLNFNGGASAAGVNDISVTITRGVADQFYNFFNDLTATTTGSFDNQISELQQQNNDYADRVTVIDDRLVNVRTRLERQYAAMEQALARLESLKETIAGFANSGDDN